MKFPTDQSYDYMIARVIEEKRNPRVKATVAYLRQQKEDAREAMDQFNDLASKIRQASRTLRKMRVFQEIDITYLTNPHREIEYETANKGQIVIQNTLPLEYSRVLSVASENGWNAKIGAGSNNDDGTYKNNLMANGDGWTTSEFLKKWYENRDLELTDVTIWANQGEKRNLTIHLGSEGFKYKKLHGDIRDILRLCRGDYVNPFGRIIG